MDKLANILRELMAMQARLEIMIDFKTEANAITANFFKKQFDRERLELAYKHISTIVDHLQKELDKLANDRNIVNKK